MNLDDPILEKSREEDRLEFLDRLMIGFTWAVAMGLFIEFYAAFGLDSTRELNGLIDRIGLFLVTVGVAGELAVEHRTHRADRRLREINSAIEMQLELKLRESDELVAKLNLKAEEEQRKRVTIEQALELMRVKSSARGLNEKFMESLSGKPKGVVDILYNPGDKEAYFFAIQIMASLRSADWTASEPRPIPQEAGDPDVSSYAPPDVRYGSSAPLTLRMKQRAMGFGENSAVGALSEALCFGLEGGGTMVAVGDPTLPDAEHFIVVVGGKLHL